MKKKLLWVLGIVVLIVGISIYFCLNNGEYKDIQKENLVQLNQEIDEISEREYLSAEECYDEKGVLNENINIDDNGNIINCYNEQGEQEGKWITYTETKSGKYKHEENYKNGNKNGKSIHYDEIGEIASIQNYKDGERDGEVVFYENGLIREKGTYVDGKAEGEYIYYFDGEWMSKTIYENGEIIDIQDNDKVFENFIEHYESENLILENIWDKFSVGGIINGDEFESLVNSVYSDYSIYYDEILNDDEEIREMNEDMYKRYYEEKSWQLLALYSMINCSEDPSNPDTYLFNLDNPQLAQEIYSKNCPKGCRYADEEDVDFICE